VFTIFLTTFGAVFIAEIVGDKLLYTTGILSARYRTVPVMIGVFTAFMLKMAAAVLAGEWIRNLAPAVVAALTAVSFIGLAITLWFKPIKKHEEKREDTVASQAAMVSFATVFFSEWGDVGQITAATMAARFSAPVLVWAGAVVAMSTKGLLAASAGAGIRRWIVERISPQVIRYAGVTIMLVLCIASVVETLSEGHA
jgi:putative Ca2+/H+ antiporter (TMEM165/GDT1 family)